MRLLRAAWVLPVAGPPLEDGAVAIVGDRIARAGPSDEMRRLFPETPVEDLGDVVLLPGLVNAHTHLSITNLKEPLARRTGFLEWLRETADLSSLLSVSGVQEAVRDGILESLRYGTALVGEVTTRVEGAEAFAGSGLMARVHFEFLGVSKERAFTRFAAAVARAEAFVSDDAIRPGLSPHAPYSVWPDLWHETALRCRRAGWTWTTHLLESPDERVFVRDGTGPLREYLERRGFWDGSFPVLGTDPVTLLWGALDSRALLVHGVHLEPAEMDRIATSGAHVCLCPRSNARLGLRPPPIAALVASGVPLCLGTDGKASNEDLGVWGEMRAVRDLAPSVAAEEILRMATLRGARALGFGDLAGSLEPGKTARLLAVDYRGGDPVEALFEEDVESRVRRVGTWP